MFAGGIGEDSIDVLVVTSDVFDSDGAPDVRMPGAD